MSMTRCTSAGRFRVHFDELVPNDDDEFVPGGSMQLRLPHHVRTEAVDDWSPVISTEEDYEGELCGCEHDFLTKGLPGKAYNYKWRFQVTPLGDD